MRQEIEAAVKAHGWTDKMLNNIPQVDSLLRETNRLYPNGVGTYESQGNRVIIVILAANNLNWVTFSNGSENRHGQALRVP